MFQTKVVEEIKTHILCLVFFFFENNAICEIMWKNIVERGRPQITVWRMRFAWWLTKATHTHTHTHARTHALTICNTYCLSTATMVAPLQQWLHERAQYDFYMYSACLVDSGLAQIRSRFLELFSYSRHIRHSASHLFPSFG